MNCVLKHEFKKVRNFTVAQTVPRNSVSKFQSILGFLGATLAGYILILCSNYLFFLFEINPICVS